MSQRDVAFALELVAEVMRRYRDPGNNDVSIHTLEEMGDELREMAGKLKAAPGQPVPGYPMCSRVAGESCDYHPLGGPDCAFPL